MSRTDRVSFRYARTIIRGVIIDAPITAITEPIIS
jgi:hypothetical protein